MAEIAIPAENAAERTKLYCESIKSVSHLLTFLVALG